MTPKWGTEQRGQRICATSGLKSAAPVDGGVVTNETVHITTSDGACVSYISHRDGHGPLPAVLSYMDGIGISTILCHMADGLA